MDPYTHTTIALAGLLLTYFWGRSVGKRQGVELAVITLTAFFTRKLGAEKMESLEKEYLSEMRRNA